MNAAVCILPGCRAESEEPGMPCVDCSAAFGALLRQVEAPPRPVRTVLAELAERDKGTRVAIARNMAIELGEEYAMANQLCWMCDQRRTCTKTSSGWECRECKEVTG